MRKRSIIWLVVIVLIFSVAVYFGMTGFQIGIYKMDPLYEQVSLGLDLTGGGYAVYQADRGDLSSEDFQSKLETTIGVLRNRLDEKGYTEATVVIQGTDRIRVEIPSKDEDANKVFSEIFTPAVLEIQDVDGVTQITGDMVESATAMYTTENNEPVVQLKLNSDGAALFGEMTAASYATGQSLNIVIDGVTVSNPVAQEPIYGGTAIISGSFTSDSAQTLAIQIESGALPLDLKEIENRTISASLGEDALNQSLLAGLVGICLLFIFMIIYYRLPGIMAVIALCVYSFIVLFLLAAIPSIQLTLPGIAGIILGVGMAVDANVIIFERFKEELATGKTLRASLNSGFSKALRTIVDSNITTVIAAVVIAIYGVGTVMGFGYTLIISIVTSMFTALVVTRALLRLAVTLNIKNMKLYTIRKSVADKAAKGGE